MKARIKKWIKSLKKRMKKSPTKGFGLIEVMIASATMIVILMAVGQMQKTTGTATLNTKLTSDFNTAITLVQSMVNNGTNCQTMLSNQNLSQVTPGPISPAQSISPLLSNGASGAPILKLGPLGNNLKITNIEFNNVTPLSAPNQYLVNLHIAASKVLPGGMVSNSTLTHDFPLVLQTNPGAGNAITKCLGQSGGLWLQGPGPTDIYYPGNVGVGTSTPGYPLDVTGTVSVLGASEIRGGGAPGMVGFLGVTTGFVGGPSGYGWIQSYGNHDLLINPILSNVGIGSLTLPSYTLHVTGTAGLSTGTAWTNASDIRLKDILGDYEYGLKEVLQLHTVRFQYKKDNALKLPSDKKLVGFIAQEVENIIPDAIHTNEKNGYLDLNADPIHWAVVNAIKELYEIVEHAIGENGSNEISELEIENTKLKEENTSIKNYLCAKDSQAPFCK